MWVVHAPGMPGTFSPPPRVSYPDMHHGTCVVHVPWCIPGSLTSGFLWIGGGENVRDIPGTCATSNYTYLVRGPLQWVKVFYSSDVPPSRWQELNANDCLQRKVDPNHTWLHHFPENRKYHGTKDHKDNQLHSQKQFRHAGRMLKEIQTKNMRKIASIVPCP